MDMSVDLQTIVFFLAAIGLLWLIADAQRRGKSR
jgi:hypothetical protein